MPSHFLIRFDSPAPDLRTEGPGGGVAGRSIFRCRWCGADFPLHSFPRQKKSAVPSPWCVCTECSDVGVKMEIHLLGSLEMTDEHISLKIPGEKLRAIVATLALTPNRPVSRNDLIDELWGDSPPRDAENSL